MVSLGDESRRQGGYFFDANDGTARDPDADELLADSHITLGVDEEQGFRRIRTIWSSAVLLIVLVALEVAVFVLPVMCDTGHVMRCSTPPYSIMIYTHAVLWFVLMLADRYMRYQHYLSRTDGYLEFYRKTRNIRRMPLMIFSAGTAFLTVVMTVLADYCKADITCPGIPLTRLHYLQGVVSLEMAIIIPVLTVYLVWTVQFNRRHATPDVNQDELLSSTFLQTVTQADIGFRDEDYLDVVLEKQADFIRYLKQHNANLGRKILKLTQEINEKAQ